MQVDDTDRRILRRLQQDPNLPASELAELSGVTVATCSRRLEKLSRTGIIRGQHAVINWAALGYEVEVALRITLDKTNPRAFDEFLAEARDVPEVTEIQTFLGRVDVRLIVLARDMPHYQQIYRSRILTLPHIADIESLAHVATIKTDEVLPL
ncbi:Lrp/AsnC family transcriptional regulator [Aliiroseovarius subalbicans]|uniref:Lrp/AsnC family transcriptional regulator n=1 Tax=Aliiroseovarius subalbicans TaxID=2925840 RepID=UPI001F586891|nr:Lrp/AsnC family transcriptional regulator [Aliiroseovarius subalbicans]MCI2399311.1 Lrp/AsnC family transcriptional regulator [Aliiroseovarius subalbicans]